MFYQRKVSIAWQRKISVRERNSHNGEKNFFEKKINRKKVDNAHKKGISLAKREKSHKRRKILDVVEKLKSHHIIILS